MVKINFQNNVTKCNADTFNTMQDNIENGITAGVIEAKDYVDTLNTYSTTEQVIGTWIDNKPLYRKVITGTLVSGDLTIDVSSLNALEIVNCYGRAGNAGGYRPLNFYYEGYYVSVRGNGSTILIAASSTYAGEPFKMVVEYTKTTD